MFCCGEDMRVCAIRCCVEPRFNVPRVGDGRGRKHTSVAVLLSLSCRCSTPALTLMRIFDRRSCLCRTLSSLATLFDNSSSWSSTICRARRQPPGARWTTAVRDRGTWSQLRSRSCCREAFGDTVHAAEKPLAVKLSHLHMAGNEYMMSFLLDFGSHFITLPRGLSKV